jgi:hypothetical protein
MEKLINNYELAKRLDAFEMIYLTPLQERLFKAQNVLWGSDTKMTPTERKRAEKAFQDMDAKCGDFKMFIEDVRKLVGQHESLVTKLSGMHTVWESKILYKGQQPKEMMTSQANMLFEIFSDLGKILEPINNQK